MSIRVHSVSVNLPLHSYSYFTSALYDHLDAYPLGVPFQESYSTLHQFSVLSSTPFHFDYSHLNDYNKCSDTGLLEEKHSDSPRKNDQEIMNLNSQGNASVSSNFNQVNYENKSKIWRPFSPPPPSQEHNAVDSAVRKKNSKLTNQNAFFSIKPSNVKIGLSKTSVFKAVKKNPFACSQCPSRYMSNRQLNSHLRVHTGSKPFRCEYSNCSKSFARNEELTRHKRIHSGFKPHQCTVCKKRFGRKDHLSKHLKTHLQTSEKKVYQCSFSGCGHRYTRSDALTRHKSTAHAIKSQK